MEFKILLRLIGKRWWVVLLILVVTVLNTLVFSFFQTPIYSSSATYVVSPSSEILNGTGFLSGLSVLGGQPTVVNTYASIATSSSVKRQASEALGLPLDQLAFLDVSSRVQSDTNIIEITVEGENPSLVQTFANQIGESTIEYIRTLNGVYDLKLLDGPMTPEKPIRPDTRLNLILSIALGFILGVGLAFLMGLNDF